MSKKFYFSTLIIALVLVCIGVSYAAEDPANTTPAAPEKKAASKSTKVYGTVKEVTDNTLKLNLEKGATNTTPEELSVVLNDKTKISSGKEVKTAADIKAGEQVMVWYKEKDGEKVASSVRILKSKKMKSMKEGPAKQEPMKEPMKKEEQPKEGESSEPSTEPTQNQ